MGDACALDRRGRNSCLLKGELSTLAKIYNTATGGKLSGGDLLAILERATDCKEEECVVCAVLEVARGTPYEAVVARIRDMAFKAEGPKSMTALLDSFLIIRLCRQIEQLGEGVKFGGLLTVDFMLDPPLSVFANPEVLLRDYKKDKWNQFQLMFNVDHRMGTGLHWTAVVVDTASREIEYFDSFGRAPPDGRIQGSRSYRGLTDDHGFFETSMHKWLNSVRLAFIKNDIEMRFKYNTTPHQSSFDFSNCGPYSLHFLRLRASGKSFDEINATPISSVAMEKERKLLYEPTDGYVPVLPAS